MMRGNVDDVGNLENRLEADSLLAYIALCFVCARFGTATNFANRLNVSGAKSFLVAIDPEKASAIRDVQSRLDTIFVSIVVCVLNELMEEVERVVIQFFRHANRVSLDQE